MNQQRQNHHADTYSHVMNAKINDTITSPTSRKMFLHFSKLKNEERCSQRRKAFRASRLRRELFRMPGAWMGTPKVSRRRNTELCDYTAFRSTLSLHCFSLISSRTTGHKAGPLLSSLVFSIHLSQSLPFSLPLSLYLLPTLLHALIYIR